MHRLRLDGPKPHATSVLSWGNGGRPWNRTRHGSPRRSYSPLPHLAARRPWPDGWASGATGWIAFAHPPVNRKRPAGPRSETGLEKLGERLPRRPVRVEVVIVRAPDGERVTRAAEHLRAVVDACRLKL